MENLTSKINEIKGEELPGRIKLRVMRKIFWYRLRLPLLLLSLSTMSLSWLIFKINSCLVWSDGYSVLKVIIADFELSYAYLSESLAGLLEVMPVNEIRLMVLNLSLIFVLGVYIYRFYKTQYANA